MTCTRNVMDKGYFDNWIAVKKQKKDEDRREGWEGWVNDTEG